MSNTSHPSARFKAPNSILSGSPLKNLLDRKLIALIAESFTHAHQEFDANRFQKTANLGLDEHELVGRGLHIARALAAHLPEDFPKASKILIASFGPELSKTDKNGLAPFYYLPHAHYIATYGLEHPADGLRANYELTKRFTAEFSIRPYLIKHEQVTLKQLKAWTRDKNPHVRRLVSEGTRPRLPWASRLPKFQKEPAPVLELLELLKDDPELYVRRSVANNIGDIAKDHWDVALKVCKTWLEEVDGFKDNERSQARCWIIRHAVRLPAQKGVKEALKLRKMAGGKGPNL